MSARLRDLIKQVRACKTAAEERDVIAKECANIRTSIKEEETEYRHRNVAKLLYIHMLGYPTHWGQMECLKLIASSFYSDKRIGYLGLMVLMDEKQELLTMVTNHMKNDLNHPSHFVAGLALCTLGNISSPGIARDLAPEVEKLLGSSNPYIRKKAALCAIRVLRKCGDLMENFVPRIRSLLSERNHGVLVTGVALMTELCESDPHNVEFFRRLVPTLVRILKNLVMSGYAPEYDVSGITDPFLQVKILRLLRLLGQGDQESSDIMNDILAQVATNTDHSRNVGNSILYEAVQTIMSIESDKDLRVLAINVLGGFLVNKDNNIRYVALNTLSKVVSADVEAVQRHRNTIVDCLKDADISIRRRALDLIYALANESNIKVLAVELLLLAESAPEFRSDLATKLCSVTERFAPNKRWHIDTILKIMSIAGQFVPDEVAANLVTLIAAAPEVHTYAVQKVYLAITKDITQQILVQVAVWCIGEFGDLLIAGGNQTVEGETISVTESDVIDLLQRIIKSSFSSPVTREYVLTALMKLTDRFSVASIEKLKQVIASFQNNIDVELQQRSCEYSKLFGWDNVRKVLLEKIPVVEERKEQQAPTIAIKGGQSSSLIEMWDDTPSTTPAPGSTKQTPTPATAPAAPLGGLDILGEIFGTPSNPISSIPVPSKPAPLSSDSLLDLLGEPSHVVPSVSTPILPSGLASISPILTSSIVTPTSAPVSLVTTSPTLQQPLNGPLPTFTAFEKNGLKILFDIVKNIQYPNVTVVNISFLNSNPFPLVNFDLKVAVPKYLKLQVNPPTGNMIPPNNSGKVTQGIKLMNAEHGQKPVVVKIKIDYLINGAPVSEVSDVNFPQGV